MIRETADMFNPHFYGNPDEAYRTRQLNRDIQILLSDAKYHLEFLHCSMAMNRGTDSTYEKRLQEKHDHLKAAIDAAECRLKGPAVSEELETAIVNLKEALSEEVK